MFFYGVGLTAYLAEVISSNPLYFLEVLIRIPRGIMLMFSPSSTKNQNKTSTYPKELTELEHKGFLQGPWKYFQSWQNARKLKQQANKS